MPMLTVQISRFVARSVVAPDQCSQESQCVTCIIRLSDPADDRDQGNQFRDPPSSRLGIEHMIHRWMVPIKLLIN